VRRRSPLLLCIAALAGLLATGTASAAEPVLPLGTDGQGVHLRPGQGRPVHGHRQLVLTFDDSAAELYRRIAGRWLIVGCIRFDRHPRPFELSAGGTSMQRAPHRRRPIPVVFNRRYDVCTVGVQHGRRTTVLTRIPLTALGAERLDERNTAVIVVAAVRLLATPERPSAATVAAQLHGVALADPAQVPPPGVLGVYSDGAEHVYAAQASRAGELLFVELEGDVTRSNVLDHLLGEDPFR
jgi:hypothetical protein